MTSQQDELVEIMHRFAQSGWDLIEEPANAWLAVKDDTAAASAVAPKLIAAIEQADRECGSCGCEFDPLYKRALALKDLLAS